MPGEDFEKKRGKEEFSASKKEEKRGIRVKKEDKKRNLHPKKRNFLEGKGELKQDHFLKFK